MTFTATVAGTAGSNKLMLNKGAKTLTIFNAVASVPFRTNIVQTEGLRISWSLKLWADKPTSPVGQIGESLNSLYVLYKSPPKDFKLYHTLADVSTNGAKGVTQEADIPGEIFDLFQLGTLKPGVLREDGTRLHYYSVPDGPKKGAWTTENDTTFGLLKDGDGQCTSFSNLFLDLLKSQGFTMAAGDKPWVLVRSMEWSRMFNEQIMVNNWTFNRKLDKANQPIKNKPSYEYSNEIAAGDMLGGGMTLAASRAAGSYQFPNPQGQNTPNVDGNAPAGLPGQNSPKPLSLFANHILIEIGGVWYDPSYGEIYDQNGDDAKLAGVEAKAIAGYALYDPAKGVLYIRQKVNKQLGLTVKKAATQAGLNN
jgi:hypothetical protein